MKKIFYISIISVCFLCVACTLQQNHSYVYPTPTSQYFQLASRTKTTHCTVHDGLQDALCTPGAVFSTATVQQICTSGYASKVRNVPESEKQQVYAEYGIASHTPGQYEVDHLVSLELGGSNNIANLWPELALPEPGFHTKDVLENKLHDLLCAGKVPLQQAQYEIATNWKIAYTKYVGPLH